MVEFIFFSLAAVSKDNLNDPLVDLKREQIRLAYSSSIRTLSTMKETEVAVDSVGGQQQGEMGAVSEGCHLAAYNFDMYKAAKYKKSGEFKKFGYLQGIFQTISSLNQTQFLKLR